jgi:preprotein translocase subunit SecG
MITFMTAVHLLFALAVIGGVLMQSGRSAGFSGAIGGGAERVFGKRKGIDEIISRWTVVFVFGFMLSALVLTVLRS